MLVISRKDGETIKVGNSIQIYVLRTHRGRLRIGIDAPDDVQILRGELDFEGEGIAESHEQLPKAVA